MMGGISPLACIDLHIVDLWIQKHSKDCDSLSAFLYKSEPDSSLTLCYGYALRHIRLYRYYAQKCRKEFKWKAIIYP